MPDCTFYNLGTSQPRDRYHLACRIAEKAYKQGQKVFILTSAEDHMQTQTIDNLLWSFRQGSFVPHQTVGNDSQVPAEQLPNTVLIGTDPRGCMATVLINLTHQVPDNIDAYQRIVEIVDQDQQIKQAGRQRYKTYQTNNIQLTTHHI
ncbi:MAG TPA: DNA polymerase III subunit chi [Crenotrichaceae bacterium]|nr:DNA polymerase III subunit chi [Crenotrichaceae bacterium]